MSSIDRVAGSERVARDRRLATVALVAICLIALGTGVGVGMPPVGLALFLALAVGLEYAANSVTTVSDAGEDSDEGETLAAVQAMVDDLSEDLGIEPTKVVYDAEARPGVGVLDEDDETVLFVSGPLFDYMNEATLRAVVAHELAHVALGHLRRVPLRDAVAHVVGVVVLWTVFLQGQPPGLTVFVAGGYLFAGLNRQATVNAILYYGGSLGLVLVPIVFDAYANRLEECQADDVAVGYTSAATFCTGLYQITTAGEGKPGGGVGTDPSVDAERTVLERFVAPYPTTERRLARHGVDLATVAEADRDVGPPGALEGTATD